MKVSRYADDRFARSVRARGRCERCGSTRDLECAHILPRVNRALRHDPENALALCRECHRWAHAHPEAFRVWIGSERLDLLRRRAGLIVQAS